MSAKSGFKTLRNICLRLLYGAASLLFISLVTFLADEVAPGDAALVRMGDKNFTQERYERIKKEMGLDRPWYVRYVEFFTGANINEVQQLARPDDAEFTLLLRGFSSGTHETSSLAHDSTDAEIEAAVTDMLVRAEYPDPASRVTSQGDGAFRVEFLGGIAGQSMEELRLKPSGQEEVRAKEIKIGRTAIPLGVSFYGTRDPVIDIIKTVLPVSMQLACLAILMSVAIGVLFGTLAAVYENRLGDKAALSVSTLGVTVPNFVLAPVLAYIFAIHFDVLPLTWEIESKMVAPKIYYMILPVVVLAARPLATLTRLTRASMIDTLGMEFVRLAVAKGVPPWRLYVTHVLRNAILPVLTGIGTSFGYLITGSFIVETAFAIPGIGQELISAIQRGDSPVIMACVIVTGSMFILVNLAVDLVQQIIDPRIRESQI